MRLSSLPMRGWLSDGRRIWFAQPAFFRLISTCMNLLLKNIAEATREMREAERFGILAKRIINHVGKYIEGYIDNAIPAEFESPANRDAVAAIVGIVGNLDFIDISHITKIPNTFFSPLPVIAGDRRKGQYLEKQGRKFIVIYNDDISNSIDRIKDISSENLDSPRKINEKDARGILEDLMIRLWEYLSVISHELVHLSDKISIEAERKRINKAVSPFKIRMGADPAEHMDDLSNMIAKTREQLYYRSEHEIRAYFLPAVHEVVEQVRDGLYVLPDTYSEFIQEFNTIYCPEMRRFEEDAQKNLEKKLFKIYAQLKKIAR